MFYVFKGSKRLEFIKTEQNTCTVSRENGQRPLFQINRLFVTVFLFLIIEDCTVKLFNNIINYATLSSEHGDYGKISNLNISFRLFCEHKFGAIQKSTVIFYLDIFCRRIGENIQKCFFQDNQH